MNSTARFTSAGAWKMPPTTASPPIRQCVFPQVDWVEARVGNGRLLVTSIDLDRELEKDPVVRQMRRSLLRYAAGDRFDPSVEVDPDAVRALVR